MRKEPGEAVRGVRCDANLTLREEEREGRSILDCDDSARQLRNH